MIPLVRPSFPDPGVFIPLWKKATQESGIYSNFGPLWWMAADRLSEVTDRIALPVSNGTEAVTLAALASQIENANDDYAPAVEAFTFEATRIAFERVQHLHDRAEWGLREVRSDSALGAKERKTGVVIRTVPFGCHRDFTKPQFDDEPTVIDAAGGFGPNAWGTHGLDATVRKDQPIAVSFHATKNFPIGEGGAVLLPLAWKRGAEAVVQAMNFGFSQNRRTRITSHYATNAKLDELRCAMLIAQLDRADYFRERCARIRKHTLRLIDHVDQLRAPYQLGTWQSLVVVQIDQLADAMGILADRGIACREVYPTSRQDLLTDAEKNLLALPSDCTDDELAQVMDALREVYR